MFTEDEDVGFDEFDLDLAWGDLDPLGRVDLYLPTGREIPGETCDTHNATCPNTCHGTCPATCANTCDATCPHTCQNTCHNTCRATCEATCRVTCDCQTNAQTHCFTCRSGCQEP